MKIKALLLSFLIVKSTILWASGVDTLRLYYNIDKAELSSVNKSKLDSLKSLLKNQSAVTVNGYADYLGKNIPNIDLSKNRAETVKQYLLTVNNTLNISANGNGPVTLTAPRSAAGQPTDRRVDIIFEHPKFSYVKRIIRRTGYSESPPRAAPPSTTGFSKKVDSLNDVVIGKSIGFEELTFQGGRHFLNPEAAPYLDILLEYLKKHSNISFQIIGHVCCEGENHEGIDMDTHQYALSANRAKYIYDYLITKGIDPKRMTYKGVGGNSPKVSPELTEHDKYLNRRVELLITGK